MAFGDGSSNVSWSKLLRKSSVGPTPSFGVFAEGAISLLDTFSHFPVDSSKWRQGSGLVGV